jgi:antitoxin component YwqK of YwqJK toxin-antitoxin module
MIYHLILNIILEKTEYFLLNSSEFLLIFIKMLACQLYDNFQNTAKNLDLLKIHPIHEYSCFSDHENNFHQLFIKKTDINNNILGFIEETYEYINGLLWKHSSYLKEMETSGSITICEKHGKYIEYFRNTCQLRKHYFCIRNAKHGEYKRYHENGNLFRHMFCIFGAKHGEFKEYYENGNLQEHAFYENGLEVGKFRKYNEDQSLDVRCYMMTIKSIDDNPFWDYMPCSHPFTFETEFAFLKFRDILKSRYRKPIYNEIDKIYMPNITNIITSYLFTLSKFNLTEKRVLL